MKAAIIFIALAVTATQIVSATTVLFAGETLRVDFQLAPPVCTGGACDTLLVFPSADTAFSSVVGAVTLYDGAQVLGSMTNSYAPVFTAPGSLLCPDLAAIIDFTSILEGTIDGSIVFTLLSGSLGWNGIPGLNLTLGRTIAPGLVMEGTSVVITNVSIQSRGTLAPATLDAPLIHNPEPASIWLAATGGATLWWWRRRRAC